MTRRRSSKRYVAPEGRLRPCRPAALGWRGAIAGLLALALVQALFCSPPLGASDGSGTIAGTVADDSGQGISAVAVIIEELDRATVTARDGSFSLHRVPVGTYSLTFTVGPSVETRTDVQVVAGDSTWVDVVVDWTLTVADTITVFAASRRLERITEAPAAISAVSQDEIALQAPSSQVPRLLESSVGTELAQGSLYDFNLNVLGFNATLTRRVKTLIDGRDPVATFGGSMEWIQLGYLTEDLEAVELVRGPSAALYGANTFNGVLNLTTRTPRSSQGGRIRLTAGELDTLIADLRWAGEIGDDWYLKVLGSHNQSEDFSRPRVDSVEYPGLPPEVLAVDPEVGIDAAAMRFDKYMGSRLLTVEGGVTEFDDRLVVIPVGRGFRDATRGWARVNLNSARWNLLAVYNSGEADDQVVLSSGALSSEDIENVKVELQGNLPLAGGRGRLVGGGSYFRESIDSADSSGMQTLVERPVDWNEQAVFGQLDYDLTGELRLVVAGRIDDGTFFDTEFSPKAYLVYAPTPGHTFRLGYTEAFQAASNLNFFLDIAAGPPLDLSFIEDQFAPLLGDVSLGLEFIPILALGNKALGVEQVRGFEIGYRGVVGSRAFVQLDLYSHEMRDFITDLSPGVNPAFPPYMAPGALDPAVVALIQEVLNAAVPGLTNDPSGAPQIVFSFGNTARVDRQGADLTFSTSLSEGWRLDLAYSWFDFDVEEALSEGAIVPNRPEHLASLGASYTGDRISGALSYRWADDFFWASGIFRGPVPSYEVVNLSAAYDLSDAWRLALNVSNLLDDAHYEMFGGSLLERRALVAAAYSW